MHVISDRKQQKRRNNYRNKEKLKIYAHIHHNLFIHYDNNNTTSKIRKKNNREREKKKYKN